MRMLKLQQRLSSQPLKGTLASPIPALPSSPSIPRRLMEVSEKKKRISSNPLLLNWKKRKYRHLDPMLQTSSSGMAYTRLSMESLPSIMNRASLLSRHCHLKMALLISVDKLSSVLLSTMSLLNMPVRVSQMKCLSVMPSIQPLTLSVIVLTTIFL